MNWKAYGSLFTSHCSLLRESDGLIRAREAVRKSPGAGIARNSPLEKREAPRRGGCLARPEIQDEESGPMFRRCGEARLSRIRKQPRASSAAVATGLRSQLHSPL